MPGQTAICGIRDPTPEPRGQFVDSGQYGGAAGFAPLGRGRAHPPQEHEQLRLSA